jgi:hypothetical protein
LASLHSPEQKSRLDLEVRGYQLLKPVGDDWDDNWLILKMGVETPKRRWNGQGPFLTTFEVSHLIRQLKAWSANGGLRESLTFTEPNLAFEKNPSGETLLRVRVGFDLECHPDGITRVGDAFWVAFDVTPGELLAFAEALGKELAPYPERYVTRSLKVRPPKP